MDDASGGEAMGQIRWRAQKAHDEGCVVVATREEVTLFRAPLGASPSVRAPRWEPLASARGAGLQSSENAIATYEGALAREA